MLGALSVRALAGAWRTQPAPPELSARELDLIAGHLIATGAAGLAWWPISHDPELRDSPSAAPLADAHRSQVLAQAVHERRLAQTLDLFRAAGLDPLLFKGWDLSRRYPARGLRSPGDIDFIVRPHEETAARELARVAGVEIGVEIDLDHLSLSRSGLSVEDLLASSRTVQVDARAVRVPGAEHDLRLQCLHFMATDRQRAVSLCDIALTLETLPAEFDWDGALRSGRARQWITATLGLAEGLLGARSAGTPAAGAGARLPRWLREEVVRSFGLAPADVALFPFAEVRGWADASSALRRRWPPNALRTIVMHGAPVRRRRPLGLQAWNAVTRAARREPAFSARRARAAG